MQLKISMSYSFLMLIRMYAKSCTCSRFVSPWYLFGYSYELDPLIDQIHVLLLASSSSSGESRHHIGRIQGLKCLHLLWNGIRFLERNSKYTTWDTTSEHNFGVQASFIDLLHRGCRRCEGRKFGLYAKNVLVAKNSKVPSENAHFKISPIAQAHE